MGEPRVTARDREVLRFAAEHRLVLAEHVGALLEVSPAAASARLRALCSAGLTVRRRVFHQQPACFQITRTGLAVADSALPAPRFDVRSYLHDAGVVWLWLAARAGTFGPLNDLISERELRSRDRTPVGRTDPLGVPLGGVGPAGVLRVHYPDLVLRTAAGQTIAVELELTGKGRSRRETILAGYASDPRIDGVLYIVKSRSLARVVRESSIRLGAASLVQVQGFRWGGSLRAHEHQAFASRSREHERLPVRVRDRSFEAEHAPTPAR
jgi:hypothetical protein